MTILLAADTYWVLTVRFHILVLRLVRCINTDLLRLMVSVVFADIENVPEYSFDFKALTVTLILFVFTYELVMYLYSRSIKRLSVKSVMME